VEKLPFLLAFISHLKAMILLENIRIGRQNIFNRQQLSEFDFFLLLLDEISCKKKIA